MQPQTVLKRNKSTANPEAFIKVLLGRNKLSLKKLHDYSLSKMYFSLCLLNLLYGWQGHEPHYGDHLAIFHNFTALNFKFIVFLLAEYK